MFVLILKKIRRQLVLLCAVALVLLAAYVSLGRQFMPAVSRYVAFFEEQIFELTGSPVTIGSLTGSFQGFNPTLQVNELSLLVGEDQDSALVFDSATIIVDMPRSVWQRQWVVKDFVVESLSLDFEQTDEGDWELRGVSSSSDAGVDIDNLYSTFLQLAQLSLRNVTINLHTLENETISFINGSVSFQNRANTHFLHVDANLQENNENLSLSFEVEGSQLSEIDGRLHLDVPEADYSALFSSFDIGEMKVAQLHGGGGFWLNFSSGEVSDLTSNIEIDAVTLTANQLEPISLANIGGKVFLRRMLGEGSLEVSFSDMSLAWQEMSWSPFNVHASYLPDQNFSIEADFIDVSLLAQFVAGSGLLDASAQEQLNLYAPRGALENLAVDLPLGENNEEHLTLKTNLNDMEIGSVGGSPKMWGINGYLEIDFDPLSQTAVGLAEVESDNFRINIPTVFTSTWDHDYVNGSLGFSVDLSAGQLVKMVSSVIVAESEVVNGRIQFTSTMNRPDEGERVGELELLVGALELDAEQKSLYLLDGPNIEDGLRNTMEWLEDAILDGELRNSGALYRGSTLPGAIAATKTFQSFYLVDQGEIDFSQEWPNLSEVSAFVDTDDNNIDIEVVSATSMNVDARAVQGEIRQNEEGDIWLSLKGEASGITADGLDYLQSAPVGQGLKNAFLGWQSEGGFTSDIEVEVPFNNPDNDTDVRLDILLNSNSLYIPEYEIAVRELDGPVIFDTRTGVEETALRGRLFDQFVNLKLSSVQINGELDSVLIDGAGLATPQALIDWPLQSNFVRELLQRMDGQIAYTSQLSINQNSASDVKNTLHIDSTLAGASMSLPYPFTKPVEIELPLSLDIEFLGDSQDIQGELGPELSFALEVEEGSIRDGLVYVGENQSNFSNLMDNSSSGLAVIGYVDRFQFEPWSGFLGELNVAGEASEGFATTLDFLDLELGTLELYDQEFHDVNMRIEPEAVENIWAIDLASESIAGQVKLPFSVDEYVELDLDYLRLAGSEVDRIGPQQQRSPEEEDVEAVDTLANIDPRTLPRMKFTTDEFRIGDRPFGSWKFTLDPHAGGAEFTDLVFDFRGLRLGMEGFEEAEELGLPPAFSWSYDGQDHRSALNGILYADDMANVLTANGYAASLESDDAIFIARLNWPGTPAFFSAENLSGEIELEIDDGRFLQGGAGAAGALKLISILNFDAIMRRLRFSDDLLRSGLAYEEISADLTLDNGHVLINDRVVISGPSSLYQITGELDLKEETILGEMFLTLPVSENIPWLGLLTANIPLAVGAYLFDRIFGSQVNSLTSAVYTLDGPWEGLEPNFKQAFGSPDSRDQSVAPQQ
ncbi:MAG: hypothetical protein HOF74_07925 [Gammaproteobacteria bacterium]|jgi:uncharacterized protein (TIGR02099 family)|nr:hypothetical protein [Gammaproteobacteria bacterium]MBT3859742.1 hypothetical protein [Gammaproteobacteria bacterium]MBT4582267.1 hypothetical protein [Gammaproteobacteria bacterium]MBT4659485.1 hypothetical protein [Gammaproteobacteria bacterium]MBT4892516.1 hypothetical protein [Gammaproteobacteria bacterium]